MIEAFLLAPFLRFESAIAGCAAELRLAILAYELRSFMPFEVAQVFLFELQRTEFALALGA